MYVYMQNIYIYGICKSGYIHTNMYVYIQNKEAHIYAIYMYLYMYMY